MNKFAKFMKKQGYYILLVLCVLLIATVITLSVVMTQRPADVPTVNVPGGNEPEDPTINPGGDDTDPTDKTFMAPVAAAYTANYDTWVKFGVNGKQKHYGIDYEAPAGTKVVASYGGKVTSVSTENGLRVLKISYDNGYTAVYRGLDANAKLDNGLVLQANTPVEAGTHIGNIASGTSVCGGCSAPHLHLEMFKGGDSFDKRVDPTEAFAESDK